MSKLRSISGEIRLSQSFARLTLRQRDLWHGLIAVADDQGRLPGLPAAVRSLVWPYDDVMLSDVEGDLDVLADMGNILRYHIEDNQYVQIINWWRYQKMQWAGRSQYPAPDGWKDRIRHHGKGRKVVSENWNTPGGFFIEINNDNDNVNDNDKVKGRPQTFVTKVDDKGSRQSFPSFSNAERNRAKELLQGYTGNFDKWKDADYQRVLDLAGTYSADRVVALTPTTHAEWCASRTKDDKPYNPHNPAWLDKLEERLRQPAFTKSATGGLDM